MMDAVIRWINRSLSWRWPVHALIAAVLLGAAYLGSQVAISSGLEYADAWMTGIKADDTRAPAPVAAGVEATDVQRKRLHEQMETIRTRIDHHLTVMRFFYSRYYMAIAVILISGLLTAVALLFVTKDGWGRADYARTVFITAAAITAYFGAFPSVFQQSQNIADNKKLYLQYVGLQNEARTYVVTGQNINGDKKSAVDFIHYLDKQLIQLNTFAIGFDDTKVPNYKGTFELK
jgi:hypothetical protein